MDPVCPEATPFNLTFICLGKSTASCKGGHLGGASFYVVLLRSIWGLCVAPWGGALALHLQAFLFCQGEEGRDLGQQSLVRSRGEQGSLGSSWGVTFPQWGAGGGLRQPIRCSFKMT